MILTKLVVVIWRLVPYHDARFSAAAKKIDLSVIEVFGLDKEQSWSDNVSRSFDHIPLTQENDSTDALKLIEQKLNELKPDVVAIQGWSDPAAYTTTSWAVKNNTKVIIFSESNFYDHPRSFWSEWLKMRVLGLCDAAFVGGRDHAAYLNKLGFDKDRVSLGGYNAIDNNHFIPKEPTKSIQKLKEKTPYFLVVTRLVKNKNLDLIIDAYANYLNKTEDKEPWGLVILGKGPLQDELNQQIADLGIKEYVHLKGFYKYEKLPQLYHDAGVLIHASKWEPWGLVVNEAMASGLPVIVSNKCGCYKELVKDGVNGFAIDPDDKTKLISLMLDMSSGKLDKEQLGKNSSEIITNWGPDRFALGLQEATQIAERSSVKKTMLDKLVVMLLARLRGKYSPSSLLAKRAIKQNKAPTTV